MVTVVVNKEKETATFSTTIKVDGKELLLSVTNILGYLSPQKLSSPKFEDVFYWSEESYINPERKHQAYQLLVDTNYNRITGNRYEVQWEQLKK